MNTEQQPLPESQPAGRADAALELLRKTHPAHVWDIARQYYTTGDRDSIISDHHRRLCEEVDQLLNQPEPKEVKTCATQQDCQSQPLPAQSVDSHSTQAGTADASQVASNAAPQSSQPTRVAATFAAADIYNGELKTYRYICARIEQAIHIATAQLQADLENARRELADQAAASKESERKVNELFLKMGNENDELRRENESKGTTMLEMKDRILGLADERDALKSKLEKMREALTTAAQTFEEYATIHGAKGTRDGDLKALANEQKAEMCRAALEETK